MTAIHVRTPAVGGDGAAVQSTATRRVGGSVAVHGLTKSFKGARGSRVDALRGLDLEVDPGEFLVLLGTSGCGKTTLLRAIAGLERPDAGTIHLDGKPLFDRGACVDIGVARRPVTMIFQSYALWPHMTAAGHVSFPMRCAGFPRREIARRCEEILVRFGIVHLANRYPSEMSGGQQQRVALARALAVGERIVLLDEPLSSVDRQIRESLRLELVEMQRTIGFTAICVTHDQSEALELADRIAVMSEGRIAQVDRPRKLYENPADITVARFIGQTNEIPLVVDGFEPRSAVVAGRSALGELAATWRPRPGECHPRGGDEFRVFGRPSDFRIAGYYRGSRNGSVSPGAICGNEWTGVVEVVRFLGPHVEYVVRIGDERVRCWTAASAPPGPGEGASVTVGAATAALQAFRAA